MKPANLAQIVFIVLAAIGVYAFVSAAQDGEARAACTALCALHPAYANQDRSAPDFELEDLDGKPFRLSQLRGKTVVLNFWTKNCRPCLEEMSSLDDLAAVLREQGSDMTLVTVSTDDSAADAKMTLQTVLGKQPSFIALVDPESKVVNGMFGTKLFPETWIIDPHGIIRARVDGARDWSNAIVLDVLKMVARPEGCGIAFDSGRPHGDRRGICAEGELVPRLCVYCGANPGADPIFVETARTLGSELARRGIGLVYGGASVGLMGAVADAVLAGGGEAIGVIPETLVAREVAHRSLTEQHVVQTMHERKAKMSSLADAFVALPGGFGTLDEIFEAVTWGQIGVHRKPCFLLDVAGYYAGLVKWIEHAEATGFVKPEYRGLLVAVSSVDALFEAAFPRAT